MISFPTPVPRLDEDVEIGVYRIAQEALTNAARHAQASTIAKDREGAITAVNECVLGGNCGDLPFELWDAFKTAGNTAVDCVFGGNCGAIAAGITDEIFAPVPLDVRFYQGRAQRR